MIINLLPVLSEQTLLPLIVANEMKKTDPSCKVTCYELNNHFRDVMEAVSQNNSLQDVLEIRHDISEYYEVADKCKDASFDLLIGEMIHWYSGKPIFKFLQIFFFRRT